MIIIMIMVVIIDNIGNSNMNEDLKTLNNSNHNIVIIRNNNQNNNFLIGHLSGNWQVLLL